MNWRRVASVSRSSTGVKASGDYLIEVQDDVPRWRASLKVLSALRLAGAPGVGNAKLFEAAGIDLHVQKIRVEWLPRQGADRTVIPTWL